MTGARYIALVARDAAARSNWEQASAPALHAAVGFEKRVAGDRLALVARGTVMLLGREGFVLGTLHERGRARAVDALDDETVQAIVASRGDWLLRAHWGDYIAVIAGREEDRSDVVRAPFGELGCLMLETSEGVFLASDVAMLRQFAGYTPAVHWQNLARQLSAKNLFGRSTCLAGLVELSGGERLTIADGSGTIGSGWPVWQFTEPRRRIGDPLEAQRRVRDAVQGAVAARAAPHDKVLLRLSGGLDSSLVAAALVGAGKKVVALTMTTRDRAGDERAHAQAVASHLGIPLLEALRDTNDVDLMVSEARRLPRPSARAFTQASLRVARDLAGRHGATAIFDGGGGDNMFASLQSVAPVTDCLCSNGGAAEFWNTARSVGMAGQTSTLQVAWLALKRHMRRGPGFRWPVDQSLLSTEAKRWSDKPIPHAWLEPPAGTLPGSAAHVALILSAQAVVQGRDWTGDLELESPLIAQPLAQACLRVPSWAWQRDGQDRVIARDAFRSALPAQVLDRRDKGAPDSFVIELLEANETLVRDMLVDGLLARAGLLDMPAIHLALRPECLARGAGYMRLMQLVDAEAWARSWTGR